MIQIQPFRREEYVRSDFFKDILANASVKNLTEDEVVTTMRLLDLERELGAGPRFEIVIHRNDKRLALCDDNDRFLAMLLDCDKRDVLLFSGRCRSLFGDTVYHWRNIGRKCPITSVASAISECGSGYYGRGWEIAPHIKRLCKWIDENYYPF